MEKHTLHIAIKYSQQVTFLKSTISKTKIYTKTHIHTHQHASTITSLYMWK